jgi:hypothetical protein
LPIPERDKIQDKDLGITWYGKDEFADVQSGGSIPTRYYGLVDKYNQIDASNRGS